MGPRATRYGSALIAMECKLAGQSPAWAQLSEDHEIERGPTRRNQNCFNLTDGFRCRRRINAENSREPTLIPAASPKLSCEVSLNESSGLGIVLESPILLHEGTGMTVDVFADSEISFTSCAPSLQATAMTWPEGESRRSSTAVMGDAKPSALSLPTRLYVIEAPVLLVQMTSARPDAFCAYAPGSGNKAAMNSARYTSASHSTRPSDRTPIRKARSCIARKQRKKSVEIEQTSDEGSFCH